MADLVPAADLVPSLPSRVVTIDVVAATEGEQASGTVTFTLLGDIHVSADRKIVKAEPVPVELASGEGSIRLPVYDGSTGDWAIAVKKSWAPYEYLVRVPAGQSSIDLSQIQPLTQAPAGVAAVLTAAGVEIVEGAQWGATVTSSGGVATFRFTVPPGAVAWSKGDLASNADLNSVVTPGAYGVGSLDITNRPPEDRYGVLDVALQATAVVQTYTTTSGAMVFVRRGSTSGTNWQAWARVDAGKVDRGILAADTDLDAVVAFGTYGVSGTLPNQPVALNGLLEVMPLGTGVMQRYTTVTATPQVYVRRGQSDASSWFAWVRTDSGAVAPSSGPTRRELLRQGLTARKGGTIGTGGAGAVALRFDDAPVEFVSKVLPLLRERGIPFTRVTTSETIHADPLPAGALAEMQSYCLADGGEVWNHGRTHGDASGPAALDAEIVGALATIRAAMPRLPIDCWAPPGGSGTIYDGHAPADTVAAWSDTYAGRLILDHHALAAGYLPNTYYRPLDGTLRDGQVHYSNDTRSVADTKTLIDRAAAWGVGVVLMWHPNNLDTAGNMTTAGLAEVLDYLVAARDGGSVAVLTASGLAVADRTRDHRDDILPVHSGAPFSAAVTYPQYRQSIPGSTRELVATVTGTAGATVTSTVGESSRTHTIPAGGILALRHVATIPLDVTTLTVTISAATTGARLLAV